MAEWRGTALSSLRAIPHTVAVRRVKLRRATRLRLLGTSLLVGSLVLTAILAIRGGSPEPPTPLESLLLGIFAAALQVSGGISFASIGRADPTHARSSVRHLQALGSRAATARRLAENILEAGGPLRRQENALGQLSVYLSQIEESAILAVEDWADFHGDAVSDLTKQATVFEQPTQRANLIIGLKRTKGGKDD